MSYRKRHLIRGAVLTAVFSATLLLSELAEAEVMNVGAGGFEVRELVHIAAAPATVYAALLVPARWWDSQHTFSGSASNLTLDARAGGCWCETLPDGGSVMHMTVVYVAPGKTLRMRGALGPLQGMAVDGAMTLSVKASGSGTDLSLTYTVGGYSKDGFESLSRDVDGVLVQQVGQIQRLLGTAPLK